MNDLAKRFLIFLTAAVPAILILGLTYAAITGWEGVFTRPGIAAIIAICLAAPFIYFMHRAVRGCKVGWVLALIFALGIGVEGGLTFVENLKHEGSQRHKQLEAEASVDLEAGRLERDKAELSLAESKYDSLLEKIGADEARLATIALLAEPEITSINKDLSRYKSGHEILLAEMKPWPGQRFWTQAAITVQGEFSSPEAVLAHVESEMKRLQGMVESNDANKAKRQELLALIGGNQKVLESLKLKKESLNGLVESTKSDADKASKTSAEAEATSHYFFIKAKQFGKTDIGTMDCAFAGGFLLIFILNTGIGFWFAIVTTPKRELASWLVLGEVVEEEEDQTESPPDNVENIEDGALWNGQSKNLIYETKARNLEKTRKMLHDEGITKTQIIATRLGVCEATARTYRKIITAEEKGLAA